MLPKKKQTVLGLYISAKEAYLQWHSSPETVKIIDVRTPEEYIYVGHAEMALNIPVGLQTYTWKEPEQYFDVAPNPEFVVQVRRECALNDTLFIICRSGGRSAIAVNLLAEAGFSNAYNVIDGMEGDLITDSDNCYLGKRMRNGWKNAGAPWTYQTNPEQMYLPAQKA